MRLSFPIRFELRKAIAEVANFFKKVKAAYSPISFELESRGFLKPHINKILASTVRSSCSFGDHNFLCLLYLHYVNRMTTPSVFLHSITQSLKNRWHYLRKSLLRLNFKCRYSNHRESQLGCIISHFNTLHPVIFPLCRGNFCRLLGWSVSKNVFVGKCYILFFRLPW